MLMKTKHNTCRIKLPDIANSSPFFDTFLCSVLRVTEGDSQWVFYTSVRLGLYYWKLIHLIQRWRSFTAKSSTIDRVSDASLCVLWRDCAERKDDSCLHVILLPTLRYRKRDERNWLCFVLNFSCAIVLTCYCTAAFLATNVTT
jgi:hypothetical protein